MNSAASVMPIKAKKRRFMKNWDTNAAVNDSAGRTSAKKIVCSTKDISANMPMMSENSGPSVAPSNIPTATATAGSTIGHEPNSLKWLRIMFCAISVRSMNSAYLSTRCIFIFSKRSFNSYSTTSKLLITKTCTRESKSH